MIPRVGNLPGLQYISYSNPSTPVDILVSKYASLLLVNQRVCARYRAEKDLETVFLEKYQRAACRPKYIMYHHLTNDSDILEHSRYLKRLCACISSTNEKIRSGDDLTEEERLQHCSTLLQYRDALTAYAQLQCRKRSIERSALADRELSEQERQRLTNAALDRYKTQRSIAKMTYDEWVPINAEMNIVLPFMKHVGFVALRGRIGGGFAPVAKMKIVIDGVVDEQAEVVERERKTEELFRLSRKKEIEDWEVEKAVMACVNKVEEGEGEGRVIGGEGD